MIVVLHIVRYISIACYALSLIPMVISIISKQLLKTHTRIRDILFTNSFKISIGFCLCGSISLVMLLILAVISVGMGIL